MTRIPYPTDDELSDEAKERLANMPPLNIARMFAGAPASFDALSELGTSILLRSELDPRLREIAILAVAHTSDSHYEGAQHENLCRALQMPEEEIRAAADGNADELDDEANMVWTFAHQIAKDVRADEELTAQILERFGRRQATELVVAAAFYSAVARIIETTGVELEEKLPTEDINPDDWTEDES